MLFYTAMTVTGKEPKWMGELQQLQAHLRSFAKERDWTLRYMQSYSYEQLQLS